VSTKKRLSNTLPIGPKSGYLEMSSTHSIPCSWTKLKDNKGTRTISKLNHNHLNEHIWEPSGK